MSILQAIVLGVVQGITEFFPISSSGHLVICQALLGMKEPKLAFDIFLHLGTLVSILIFFRQHIIDILVEDRKMIAYLIVASAVTFFVAHPFQVAIERTFGDPKFVGYMLFITGIWLIAATIIPAYYRKTGEKRRFNIIDSVIIGIAQGIAIFPGISRTGATISTGMLAGLDREHAFNFAFLLAVPAILGACFFKAREITGSLVHQETLCFLAGGLAAMITGLAAIKMLLGIIRKGQLYIFGIYCLLAGLAITLFYKG
jgi:undecaprenyl-diphosphatase